MSRLIRLYPPAWRVRYEDELLDAASYRPLGMRDRLDLVRGAVDARIHPELAGPPVGAPVPVGPDIGGSAVSRSAFPLTVYLAILASLAFACSAVLVFMDTRDLGGDVYRQVMLVLATLSLGAAAWRSRPDTPLVWVAAGTLAAIALLLGWLRWPPVWLSATVLLASGTVLVGLGVMAAGIVARRWVRACGGLALIGLAIALSVSFAFEYARVFAAVLGAYALVSLRLGTPDLTVRRATLGILGGVAVIGVATVASIATSSWHRYDGYELACPGDRAACLVLADRMAGTVRSDVPGAMVTRVEVFADTSVEICWQAPRDEDWGCWHTGPN